MCQPQKAPSILDQIDDYLDEKSTESSQEFFLDGVDSRSCSVSAIKNEVLLRGVISFDMAETWSKWQDDELDMLASFSTFTVTVADLPAVFF